MSDLTIRCSCGVYLHSTELTAEQIIDLAQTWSAHQHDHPPDEEPKEDTP